MNRHATVLTAAALLAGVAAGPAQGQSAAPVELHGERFGIALALGSLFPSAVAGAHAGTWAPGHVVGWVAADWGPVRVWVGTSRPVARRSARPVRVAPSRPPRVARPRDLRVGITDPIWVGPILDKGDLKRIVGKETVKRIERHARWLGLKGPMRGRWLGLNRATAVLEVTVRGVAVAELYDYGDDGWIDEIFLRQATRYVRYR